MTDIEKLYEKETGKKLCFGDTQVETRTDEYKNWLEQKAEEGQKAIAAMKQIGDLVYNCSCHADTSNAVTRIFRVN